MIVTIHEQKLVAAGLRALSVEGYPQGTWILMDYGDFLLHIFLEERRDFFAWRDSGPTPPT